jgi:hypothetical protein
LELQNTAGVTVAGVDASGNPVGGLAHPPTFKNIVINGAMQVAQRGTSVTGITGTGYNTADRWRTVNVTLGTWTQTVENDAPTGSGFRKSLKMLCTTADASPAAGDLLILHQLIEGQNLQQIAKGTSSAKELTLSFWVKSNVTGTYIVGINDSDNTRNISKSYTINASATWEKKTVIFAADTTGVLDNDNFVSLQTDFYLGAGSNWTSGTLGTSWASTTNANTAVGQTNLAASTNNYWQITGVQLEVGSTATEFEFLPAQAELALCQRYYQVYGKVDQAALINLVQYNSTELYGAFILPVPMRAAPTADVTNATNAFTKYGNATGVNFSTIVVNSPHTTKEIVELSATVSGTTGQACWIRTNAAATKLGFTAEL